MRQSKHRLVDQDLTGIVKNIIDITQGDFAAASRRLHKIDALLTDIWYASCRKS